MKIISAFISLRILIKVFISSHSPLSSRLFLFVCLLWSLPFMVEAFPGCLVTLSCLFMLAKGSPKCCQKLCARVLPWKVIWLGQFSGTHPPPHLDTSIFRHFTRAGEILSREEPVYLLPACRLSSFNQVGGKAGGPQYLLCERCLISSVFSTLHMDSSCTERVHFSLQTRNSRVLLPPRGRCSHPEEIEHLGSTCYLNRMQSCVSSSL